MATYLINFDYKLKVFKFKSWQEYEEWKKEEEEEGHRVDFYDVVDPDVPVGEVPF